MRPFLVFGCAAAFVVLSSTSARADATLFIGSATSPATAATKGLAIGFGILVVGFEFEFADQSSDPAAGLPALRTGMGNLLLQTPFPVARTQFYFTVGAGGYREQLEAHQETHLGINTGGGVKITVVGPLRARLDYRVFSLRGEPIHRRVQRVYAGLNLAF